MTHVVIIGAYGSAGAAVAGELAPEEGIDLTLIDNGDPGGGLCILDGCMPSKELLSAGAHRFQARHDERLDGAPPAVDLEATVERKDDHVLGWAEHRREGVQELAERETVEFVHATAESSTTTPSARTGGPSRPTTSSSPPARPSTCPIRPVSRTWTT